MDDYIDRDALTEQVNERLKQLRAENGYYDAYTDGFDECVDMIEDFPDADVAPVVRGRWEKSRFVGYLVCSNCQNCYIPPEGQDDGKWQFCPHCGARMTDELVSPQIERCCDTCACYHVEAGVCCNKASSRYATEMRVGDVCEEWTKKEDKTT